MNPNTVVAVQQLISAAVTPVVMISACATLVLVINSKLSNIADRLRAFAAEFRHPDCSPGRRAQLLKQSAIFQRRYVFVYAAHIMLNLAIITFILTVPIILYTQRRLISSNAPTLILFISGIFLMLLAMLCELYEVSLARHSLDIDLDDMKDPPGAAG